MIMAFEDLSLHLFFLNFIVPDLFIFIFLMFDMFSSLLLGTTWKMACMVSFLSSHGPKMHTALYLHFYSGIIVDSVAL